MKLMRMRSRRMGNKAKVFYFGMLSVFVLLALMAAIASWWFYSFVSLLLGLAFIVSGPFVLARAWRAPEPRPTRRPVVRRGR